MRFSITLALAAALVAAPIAAHAEATVAVVPFAPLNGLVPPRGGAKASMLLASELKNLGGFQPKELLVDSDNESTGALNAAREFITEAEGLQARRKYGAATTALRKAIESFDKAASRIDEIAELSDAHLALAIVLFLTGNDAEGTKELANAIALTPTRTFPQEKTSPLFAAKVKETKDQLFAERGPRGILQIDSLPLGAQVLVDGVDMGRTPLVYRELPPGKHHWRVIQSSSEPAGGVVTLVPSGRQAVSAKLVGESLVAKLNSSLVNNKLDDAAIALVKQIAQEQETAFVVFGTLYAQGEELFSQQFLYSAANGTVARLADKAFDTELLSAGTAMYEVATDISTKLEGTGASLTFPSVIYSQAMPASAMSRTERAFEYKTCIGDECDVVKTGPRAPIDPSKKAPNRRVQLRDRER